jgi:SAM-dependent methyltransferase
MLDIAYLNELRRREIEDVLPLLPSQARVLEFGSGTGEQARFLAEQGFDVVALDLATSNYADKRIYPVQDYDGHRIPLDDGSVDVIFSSNVLEHVENFEEISAEFRRVLRPDGFAVHVLPTTAWRFWTLVTGAADSLIAAAGLPACLIRKPEEGGRNRRLIRQLRHVASGFVPKPHGTSHDGVTELWAFSREAWRRKFNKGGFEIVQERPLGRFYSGNMLLGRHLSMARRQTLGPWFGSATRVYIVRPS